MDLEHAVSDRATTAALYRIILDREADSGGLDHWSGKSISEVVRGLQTSQEFLLNLMGAERLTDRAIEEAQVESKPWMVPHYVRSELVQTRLPGGQRVLDLAGVHSKDPRGSLLTNGYPYRPAELHIVDLLPGIRPNPSGEGDRALTWGGTSIQFHSRSKADLADFEQDYFDLVWSGKAIERITEDDVHTVFSSVKRVLRPGGKFCLVTPNRHLTRLRVGPGNLVHQDHKKEYYLREFIDVFGVHGLSLKEQFGIIHMPHSADTGVFDMEEYKQSRSLNDDPLRSYMFYLVYQKL